MADAEVRSASTSGRPIQLLVVDDEPDVRTLFESRLRRELRSGAMEVRFATDGHEALTLARADPGLEVVVTDLNMPGMDGLELLGHLEALPRPLKTIVLTAYGDMDNIRTAMMRGAFDFQVKPLDITDLRTTVVKAATIVRELREGEEARRRADALAEKNEHLRAVFGRYVSDDVVAALLASPESPTLGGEVREISLLMADIRGFTRLAEDLPPEGMVTLLNRYLEVASDIVLRRGGTINEILGDGLLVFFGAPMEDPRHAEHAVAAAIELQLTMADLNVRNRADGLPELAVGIAVHTGDAVVGTLGSEHRMKYGAVGRNVNLVSRIESYTVGGQVLLSEETYDAVRDLVTVTGHFPMRSKGIHTPRDLFVARGIGPPYGLQLPQRASELADLPSPAAIRIARVIATRVADASEGELVAVGDDAARIRTPLVLAPLDDAALYVKGETVYGKVSECDYVGGLCHLTLVYTSADDRIRSVVRAAAGG